MARHSEPEQHHDDVPARDDDHLDAEDIVEDAVEFFEADGDGGDERTRLRGPTGR